MMDRASLLKEIDEVSFAVNELTLYLDTHPDCRDAITCFNELAPKREQLMKQFAENFEPLTVDCIAKSGGLKDHFVWLDGPAPWEGGANHVEL